MGVDAPDNDGKTPLMHASAFAHSVLVSVLLEAKADANATSGDGCNALSLVTESLQHACLNLDQRKQVHEVTNLLIAAQGDSSTTADRIEEFANLTTTCKYEDSNVEFRSYSLDRNNEGPVEALG